MDELELITAYGIQADLHRLGEMFQATDEDEERSYDSDYNVWRRACVKIDLLINLLQEEGA